MLGVILASVLTLSDLRGLTAIAAPRISPDGRHVVAIVRRADFAKNRFDGELVLVDAASGALRPLVTERRGISSPRWSPDGRSIAFVAVEPAPEAVGDAKPRKPKPQLYVLPLDGGEARRVTAAEEGVASFAWEPDGRGFAYVSPDPSPDKARIDKHDDWFTVGDVPWNTTESARPDHLWTIAADGSANRRVTMGPWSLVGEPAVAAGARTAYAVRRSGEAGHYRDRTLVAIDLRSGAVRTVRSGPAEGPALGGDGKTLFFGAERTGAFAQTDLWIAPAAGPERDLSVRFDRNVIDFVPAPDGGALAVVHDGVRARIVAFAPDGASHVLPLGEVAAAAGISVARDGTLAFTGAAPDRPDELYVLRPHAGAPVRLTHLNAKIAAHTLGSSREITWRTRDGFTADGVLTTPPEFSAAKKYPLVLVIHGGPTATSTLAFSSLVQLMTARGWVVFQPNYRGSDNLGWRFAQTTVPGITSVPGADILAGLDAVTKLGFIDTARIGVSGWSEGGLLTSWLIGHDTRWRAAMTGAGVHDWVGYANLTDARDFTPNFLGTPLWSGEKAAALYAAESPLSFANAVKTPTLIMTDAGDGRVPTPLSYAFAHALRAAGVPVEMVVIPADGHFPADPLHREDVNRRWVDWFAAHF